MGVTRKNVEFAKRIFTDRLGDPYVYGGTWNPFDLHEGCDCSGEVTDELGAVYFGTDMHWDREGLSTESYRYKPLGTQTVGPFAGLVHVASPGDIPADAAVKIALHHGGQGGPDSHMWCEVDGVLMETNGDKGTIGAPLARTISDSYANDWWYLPGPILEDGTPATTAPVASSEPQDTLFADVSEFQTQVDDSYPYRVLSIRICDGTYQDHNFAENYAWMKAALDSGKLTMGIVYTYVRPNWQGTASTLKTMFADNGGLHPKVTLMLDVESGGNPAGDGSAWVDALYDDLVKFTGDSRRVIGYGNTGDLNSVWVRKPTGVRLILAAYGSNPAYPGEVAHQYTDGAVGAGSLPSGCPPFGNCDMNSADGLSPSQFAAVCGIDSAPLGGFLMALSDAQQQQIYDKITTVWGSRSAFRHWGEGPVDDTVGIELNDDGMEHVQLIIKLAEYGDPQALALLHEVANGDLAVEPNRAADKALAQRVLDRLQSAPVAPVTHLSAPAAQAVPADFPVAPAPAATPATPTSSLSHALEALIASLPAKAN